MNEEENVPFEDEHRENVKKTIDKILGQTTEFSRQRRTKNNKQRLAFEKIITGLESVYQRGAMMNEIGLLDFESYDEEFHIIIDNLMGLLFNKDQMKLINYYLYERYLEDGSTQILYDETSGREMQLNNPNDLWEIIQSLK